MSIAPLFFRLTHGLDAAAALIPVQRRARVESIKPLVFRIKRRHRDVNDFHRANGAMAAAGLD